MDLKIDPAHAKPVAVHLFSGPTNRPDGICALLEKSGWVCVDLDNVNCPPADFSSDLIWLQLRQALDSGLVDAIIAGPPCSTFSRARAGINGPRPLRSKESPYGLAAGLLPE